MYDLIYQFFMSKMHYNLVNCGFKSLKRLILSADGKESNSSDRKGQIIKIDSLNIYSSLTGAFFKQQLIANKPAEPRHLAKLLASGVFPPEAIFTADAASCRPYESKAIIEASCDYVLALKANNDHTYDRVVAYLDKLDDVVQKAVRKHFEEHKPVYKEMTLALYIAVQTQQLSMQHPSEPVKPIKIILEDGTICWYERTVDKNHGGVWIREYFLCSNTTSVQDNTVNYKDLKTPQTEKEENDIKHWSSLKSIGFAASTFVSDRGDSPSFDCRYYLTSLDAAEEVSAFELKNSCRRHWAVIVLR
jgi:hypothetical protein